MGSIDIGRLKRDINFLEVASQFGYKLNKTKSTANSIHLKSEVDSIIVKKDDDAHWVYFNVHDSSDKGSIVDFIMCRQPGLTFSAALKRIEKDYLGKVLDVPQQIRDTKIIPVKKDRHSVSKLFEHMTALNSSKYLQSRGIEDAVLQSRRFTGTVVQDSYQNVVFPHIDKQGVCGFEMRNSNFKGFAKGGIKSVWLSNRLVSDDRLMIVESGIDALSHFALFNEKSTRYMSIGGEPSPDAWALALKIMNKFNMQGGEIISGVDNDKGGEGLDEKLTAMTSIPIKRELPKIDDWNEMLTSKMKG